jgi:hypothetical protein
MIRMREERGAAMVIALLVTMVVLVLSITVVQLSIHSSTSSAYDRRRTIAVDTSEAGVDDYYHYLADFVTVGSTLTTIECARAGEVTTGPNEGAWTSTLTLYSYSGGVYTPISCPPPAGVTPDAAKVTSIGRSPSNALLRTMESFMRISPIYGGFNQAMLTTSPTTIGNKITLNGLAGDDSDVWVSCPSSPCSLTLNNNQVIAGNLYVQGAVTMSNSVYVSGDVWATGSVSLSTGATVQGSVKSSGGSISVTNPAWIAGDATAAGTASDVSRIGGTTSPGAVVDPPPSRPLPQITFNATEQAAWQAKGFEIKTFTDCTSAKNFILSIPSATNNIYGTKDYVVYVNVAIPCTISFGNNSTINLPGSLAVMTKGGISMSQKVVWQASNPNGSKLLATGADAQLFLISIYRSGLVCNPPTPGPYDISTSNNTDFLNVSQSPILSVFMYSPCAVNLANQNAFNGQVMAKTLNVQNQMTLNFQPVLVPGVAEVTGFTQDVQYKREIG